MHFEPTLLPALWTLNVVEVLAVLDIFGMRVMQYLWEFICLGVWRVSMII